MTTTIKMRRVAGDDQVREVGDFAFLTGPDGTEYLTMKTPTHGQPTIPVTGPHAWTFDGNRDAPTLSPSVWHDKGGDVDWHGFIQNGEMRTC